MMRRKPLQERMHGRARPAAKEATSTKYHMPHMHTFHVKIHVREFPKKGVAKYHVKDFEDMVFHTNAVLPDEGIAVDVLHLHGNYRPQITGFVGDPTVELSPTAVRGETLYYIVGYDDNNDLVRVLADYQGAIDMGFGRWT